MSDPRPICKCGKPMVIRDLSCGIASIFWWECPKEWFWNRSKHSEHISLGTGVPQELGQYMV